MSFVQVKCNTCDGPTVTIPTCEWIKCTDHLPDFCTEVIIADATEIDFAFLTSRGWRGQMLIWDYRDDPLSEDSKKTPTHWMSIPELPREKS